jgi:hypothetical protein
MSQYIFRWTYNKSRHKVHVAGPELYYHKDSILGKLMKNKNTENTEFIIFKRLLFSLNYKM